MINEVLELVRSLARSMPVETRVDALSRDIQLTNHALNSLVARTQLPEVQRKINYAFNVVDLKVLGALKGVLDNFKAIAALPAIAPHIDRVDFEKIESRHNGCLRDERRRKQYKTAGLRPQGCLT
jgi:Tfp pilus assembly protein PilO